MEQLEGEQFAIVPRLSWLAPMKANDVEVITRGGLRAALLAHFALSPAPLMLASVREVDGWAVEMARGFIVPDDCLAQAAAR